MNDHILFDWRKCLKLDRLRRLIKQAEWEERLRSGVFNRVPVVWVKELPGGETANPVYKKPMRPLRFDTFMPPNGL